MPTTSTTPTSQAIHLVGTIAGEMALTDVPMTAAGQARFATLKGTDTDPFEVVIRIAEGESTKGWYYTPTVLERFHEAIQAKGMAGYKGHRKTEELGTVFPDPVTHWLGSKLVDEAGKKVLYARGLVDAAAGELKRWLKGGAVTQPSFFGNMRLVEEGGKVRVVDTTPMSIDWAPLGGAGLPTSIVAMTGEMDSILAAGEQQGTNTGSTTTATLPGLVRHKTPLYAASSNGPRTDMGTLGAAAGSSGAPGAQPPASPAVPAGLVRERRHI